VGGLGGVPAAGGGFCGVPVVAGSAHASHAVWRVGVGDSHGEELFAGVWVVVCCGGGAGAVGSVVGAVCLAGADGVAGEGGGSG